MSFYEDLAAKQGIKIPLDAMMARRAIKYDSNKSIRRGGLRVDGDGLRICSVCEEHKEDSEFSRNNQRVDGRNRICDVCKEKKRLWKDQ